MPGYDEVTPVCYGTLHTYTPGESIGTQAKVLAPSRGLIDSCSKILRNHYLWGNHTFLPKYSAWSSCSSRTKMRTRRVKSSRVGYAHL
ncbi:hypothetical protein HBH69_101390 [Parastagonospora nodorum]|nr:hypothetical protein HBH69_101390 [Parastagonospora nodorum]KAH5475262.1 hypothetical protein HBI28_105500 [Parastagonospora nodorum]KAH5650421.1 hypothetical protein HBI22_004890 [Parastagonospora nodorum]